MFTTLLNNREGGLPVNVSRLRLLLRVSGNWEHPQEEIGYWWKDLFTTYIGGFDMGQGSIRLAMKAIKSGKAGKAKKAQPRTLDYGTALAVGTDKKNAANLTIKLVHDEEYWEDIVTAHVCVTRPKADLEQSTGQIIWSAKQARIAFRSLPCKDFGKKQAADFAALVDFTFDQTPKTITDMIVDG